MKSATRSFIIDYFLSSIKLRIRYDFNYGSGKIKNFKCKYCYDTHIHTFFISILEFIKIILKLI